MAVAGKILKDAYMHSVTPKSGALFDIYQIIASDENGLPYKIVAHNSYFLRKYLEKRGFEQKSVPDDISFPVVCLTRVKSADIGENFCYGRLIAPPKHSDAHEGMCIPDMKYIRMVDYDGRKYLSFGSNALDYEILLMYAEGKFAEKPGFFNLKKHTFSQYTDNRNTVFVIEIKEQRRTDKKKFGRIVYRINDPVLIEENRNCLEQMLKHGGSSDAWWNR
jgi:hypothetical protein